MTLKAIDTEAELDQIMNFVHATWTISHEMEDGFVAACQFAFNQGMKRGQDWNDMTSHKISSMKHDRLMLCFEQGGDWRSKDSYYVMFSTIDQIVTHLHDKCRKNWNYSSEAARITRHTKRLIGTITPKGYETHGTMSYSDIKDIFCDFDDFDYYDSGEHAKQKAMLNLNDAKMTASLPFMERIAMHTVMHNDVNQGLTPHDSLMHAVFTHGLNVGEHNASYELINLLNNMVMPDEVTAAEIPERDQLRNIEKLQRGIDSINEKIERKKRIDRLISNCG